MPDMIPVSKVAAAAMRQVNEAQGCFPQTYHDSDKAAKAKVHLQVALELMAMIAGPPPLGYPAEDGGWMPVAAAPLTAADLPAFDPAPEAAN